MRQSRIGIVHHLLLGLWAIQGLVQATQYDFVIENEDIFTPCEGLEDSFIDKFFDISQLNYEREDSMIHISGPLVLTKELDDVPMQLDAQVYRLERGEWVDTIYNIKRSNLCPELYESKEIWYQYTQFVPEDQRSCPPPVNLSIDFDNLVGLSYDLPDRNAEGEYKLQVKLAPGPDLVCFEIFASVFKAE